MGMMDDAIAETVKTKKDFKKTNIKKEAIIATDKQVGGDHLKLLKARAFHLLHRV